MSVFGGYAKYYDLLYRDKNYVEEARFVQGLMKKFVPGARSVLELGCGTGAHAECLANAGFEVHGVDISREMLRRAELRRSGMPLELQPLLVFDGADVRNVRIGRRFDVVLSLFHVISYQATNADLLAALTTARKHLDEGGIFIFDCWYGPAVLTDRPRIRVKRLEDEEICILRIAEPSMWPNDNLVDVDYQVIIRHKESEAVEQLHETHRMRYLFRPELEHFLGQAGFRMLEFGEWMTGNQAGFETWSAFFAAKAV